jgi:hypothetical protein
MTYKKLTKLTNLKKEIKGLTKTIRILITLKTKAKVHDGWNRYNLHNKLNKLRDKRLAATKKRMDIEMLCDHRYPDNSTALKPSIIKSSFLEVCHICGERVRVK